MSCQIFNLIDDNALRQGETFDWLNLYYPVDVSGWTARGQVRRNYAYKDDEILATFTFNPLAYGSYTVDGASITATKINPVLTAVQTASLPIPRSRSEGVDPKAGSTAWVYDLEIVSPGGKVIRVSSGFVDVCPEVTAS